jgi:phosphoglycolate phosphatase
VGDLRRLIVFDLDGTLIDSRRDLADAANALLVELGAAPLAEEAIGGMVGEGAAALVRRALAAAGLPDNAAALARFLDLYDARLLRHTRLYDGIREVVRFARRHARLAVLTNKPSRPAERILEALQIRALIDEVVGGDGPYPRKPDPAALLALMAAAGSAGDTTLVVGDSAIDLATARRASARCCIVSYGFGFGTLSGVPLDRERVAAGVRELQEAIGDFLRLTD